MTAQPCSQCGRPRGPGSGRGLCSPCYQRAKDHGTLPEPEPAICANPKCGQVFTGRRWGAIYCSTGCKEAARPKRLQPAMTRRRTTPPADWKCAYPPCSKPMTLETYRADANFCSRKCRQDQRNADRAAAKQAAKVASRQPCANPECGKPIPENRTGKAIYCSPDCKKQVHDARWRQRRPGYMPLHRQLYKEQGRASDYACVMADETCDGPMQWANVSQEYLNTHDFMPLCQSHHVRYDGGLL